MDIQWECSMTMWWMNVDPGGYISIKVTSISSTSLGINLDEYDLDNTQSS